MEHPARQELRGGTTSTSEGEGENRIVIELFRPSFLSTDMVNYESFSFVLFQLVYFVPIFYIHDFFF